MVTICIFYGWTSAMFGIYCSHIKQCKQKRQHTARTAQFTFSQLHIDMCEVGRKISYGEFEISDFISLVKMSLKLWTDFEKGRLEKLLEQTVKSEKNKVYIAKDRADKPVGFSIFSIRTDYVEGASQSPTGYLEGIFVEPEYRKMGIAREFIRWGEKWCRDRGCTQIGSDTWLTATESREFHKKVGFREEEEVVHFLKDIE